MKKVLFALLILLVFVPSAFAARHKVGMVERLNVTPEEFMKIITETPNIVVMANNTTRPEFSFYRSMNEMIMALKAGEIDEMLMPETVVDYMLDLHPEYVINCIVITRDTPFLLSFGFSEKNKELAEAFNRALAEMKRDGTLIALQGRYVMGTNTAMFEESTIANLKASVPPESIVFRKFDDAPEIKIAVTGDMPPIDYIAADGSAQGFNAAVLAEIAKRLGLNVKLQNIESGARAAMLASGRSDAVFWFEHRRGSKIFHDAPKGVILSEPYYEFDTFYHLKPAD